jgi:hypothetical protein
MAKKNLSAAGVLFRKLDAAIYGSEICKVRS